MHFVILAAYLIGNEKLRKLLTMTVSLACQNTIFLYIRFCYEFVDLMAEQTGAEEEFFIFHQIQGRQSAAIAKQVW